MLIIHLGFWQVWFHSGAIFHHWEFSSGINFYQPGQMVVGQFHEVIRDSKPTKFSALPSENGVFMFMLKHWLLYLLVVSMHSRLKKDDKKGYMPAALILFSKFSQESHPETSIYISLASILSHELPGCKGVQETFKMRQVATMNRIRISILKSDRQDQLWVKDSATIIIIILTVPGLHCSAQVISCIT